MNEKFACVQGKWYSFAPESVMPSGPYYFDGKDELVAYVSEHEALYCPETEELVMFSSEGLIPLDEECDTLPGVEVTYTLRFKVQKDVLDSYDLQDDVDCGMLLLDLKNKSSMGVLMRSEHCGPFLCSSVERYWGFSSEGFRKLAWYPIYAIPADNKNYKEM